MTGYYSDAGYELDAPTGPHQILQYVTEMPRRLAATAIGRASDAEGRVVFVSFMDADFVAEAIEKRMIDSDPACEVCLYAGPCISSEQDELRHFVSKYDEQLYPSTNWDRYVEIPGVH